MIIRKKSNKWLYLSEQYQNHIEIDINMDTAIKLKSVICTGVMYW